MVTISNEQKIYELSQIWKDAEYNFAFWDKVNIDWDAEYKKLCPGCLQPRMCMNTTGNLNTL